MKRYFKVLLVMAVVAAGVALCAPGPDASSEHYVVTNDNNLKAINTGTVLKLGGSENNPLLGIVGSLNTNTLVSAHGAATPSIQIDCRIHL